MITVTGRCPFCSAKVGCQIEGDTFMGAYIGVDPLAWHKAICPNCGRNFEFKMSQYIKEIK